MYITQEKEDEMCIGIANLSYGQLPKHVLQQVSGVSAIYYHSKSRRMTIHSTYI